MRTFTLHRFAFLPVAIALAVSSLSAPVTAAAATGIEDPSRYVPVPVSRPEPTDEAPVHRGRIVRHDLVTGKVTYSAPVELDRSGFERDFVEGVHGEPGFDLEETGRLERNFGSFNEVSDPSQFPFRMHTKIFMNFTSQGGDVLNYACSGTMIDARFALTAGHCVYLHETNDGTNVYAWADSVKVAPGWEAESGAPFGFNEAVALYSWDGWTADDDWDHDIAYIELARPVGALTGWRAFGFDNSCSWFTSGNFTKFLYPASGDFDGLNMYTLNGDYDGCETYGNEVWSDKPGRRGSSGGGAVKDDVVWAVRSNTFWDPFTHYDAWDTRITSGKFDDMVARIAASTPDLPDLSSLDVNVAASSASLGEQMPLTDVLLFNDSDAAFDGTVNLRLVLSQDDQLTLDDPIVSSTFLNLSLGPKQGQRITLDSGPIPLQLAPVLRRVGVVIEAADGIASNNATAPMDQARLNLACPDQAPAPTLVSPADREECMNLAVGLDWTYVAGAAGYKYQIGTACGFGEIRQTQNTYEQVTGLQPFTRYHWRVASTQPGCNGEPAPWSACSEFTTGSPDAPLAPVTTLPVPDDQCVPTQTLFRWEAVPNTDAYEIQYGLGACAGRPIERSNYTYFRPDEPLTSNALYWWRVRAVSDCGEVGAWSECRSFRTSPPVDTPVPALPQDGAQCVGTPTLLDWNGVSGAVQYSVTISTDPDYRADASNTHTTQLSSITLDLEPNTRYFWSVSAVDDCGERSNPSNPWRDFYTAGPGPAPPTADREPGTDFHCSGPRVSFSWEPISGATAYQVQVGSSCGEGNLETTSDPFLTVENAPEGSYSWRVRARNSCSSWGAWSDCKQFDVYAGENSAEIEVESDSHQPSTWSPDPVLDLTMRGTPLRGCEIVGFLVAVDALPDTTATTEWSLSDSTFTSEELTPGTPYYAHVIGVDRSRRRALGMVHYGPLWIDDVAPQVVVHAPVGGEQFPADSPTVVRWQAQDTGGSDLASQQVSYSPNAGVDWISIGSVDPTDSTLAWVTPTTPTEDGLVRVRAVDGAGNAGEATSTQTFTIGATTTQVPSVPSRLELAANVPNPFNPRTTVRFYLPHTQPTLVTIHDVQGRLVRRLVDEQLEGGRWYERVWEGTDGDGRAVVSGVYFLRLRAGDETRARRMVLVK